MAMAMLGHRCLSLASSSTAAQPLGSVLSRFLSTVSSTPTTVEVQPVLVPASPFNGLNLCGNHMQVLPFKTHKIDAPSNVVETSTEDLVAMFGLMYKMRRMEIAADMMYKAKLIRGFCHL
jgi:hypothetical protein